MFWCHFESSGCHLPSHVSVRGQLQPMPRCFCWCTGRLAVDSPADGEGPANYWASSGLRHQIWNSLPCWRVRRWVTSCKSTRSEANNWHLMCVPLTTKWSNRWTLHPWRAQDLFRQFDKSSRPRLPWEQTASFASCGVGPEVKASRVGPIHHARWRMPIFTVGWCGLSYPLAMSFAHDVPYFTLPYKP